jgi:hypothetical protein
MTCGHADGLPKAVGVIESRELRARQGYASLSQMSTLNSSTGCWSTRLEYHKNRSSLLPFRFCQSIVALFDLSSHTTSQSGCHRWHPSCHDLYCVIHHARMGLPGRPSPIPLAPHCVFASLCDVFTDRAGKWYVWSAQLGLNSSVTPFGSSS